MIKISFEMTDAPARLIVTELMPYPLSRVWLAETEGLYVKQWWAPSGYANDEVDITTVEGGAWRILQRDPEGNQFSFYGKVESSEHEEKLVISLVSEVWPDSTVIGRKSRWAMFIVRSREVHSSAPLPDTNTTPRTLPTGKSVERWNAAMSRARVTPAVTISTAKSAALASAGPSGSSRSLGPSTMVV